MSSINPMAIFMVIVAGIILYLALRGRLGGVWSALQGQPIGGAPKSK